MKNLKYWKLIFEIGSDLIWLSGRSNQFCTPYRVLILWYVHQGAGGYTQREDIDYNKKFSPIVKHSSIRILLALIAQYDFKINHLDVKIGFLRDDLEEGSIWLNRWDLELQQRRNWCVDFRSCFMDWNSRRDSGTSVSTSLWLAMVTPRAYSIHAFIFASYRVVSISIYFVCRWYAYNF